MLCADQFLLSSDEDRTVQSKPPFINGSLHDEDRTVQSKPPFISGSLHDGFPLSIVGDCLYIGDLINRFRDLLFSPSKSVSQASDSVYLFKTRFLNLLCMSRWLNLCFFLIGW
jgi:hypothetical protein